MGAIATVISGIGIFKKLKGFKQTFDSMLEGSICLCLIISSFFLLFHPSTVTFQLRPAPNVTSLSSRRLVKFWTTAPIVASSGRRRPRRRRPRRRRPRRRRPRRRPCYDNSAPHSSTRADSFGRGDKANERSLCVYFYYV